MSVLLERLKELGGYWEHDGEPQRPHIITRAGLHSGHFVNCRPLIAHPAFFRDAVYDLLGLFVQKSTYHSVTDMIVGPQTGATKLAEALASALTVHRNLFCDFASPEKRTVRDEIVMVFTPEECEQVSGKLVTLCDDVITTAGSVRRTARAISEAGGVTTPLIVCLVNRSGLQSIHGRQIVALVDRSMPAWAPEECPLCLLGSEALTNPKEPQNWARLTATY